MTEATRPKILLVSVLLSLAAGASGAVPPGPDTWPHTIPGVRLNEHNALFMGATLKGIAQRVFKFIYCIKPVVNIARRIEPRNR